MERSDFIEDGVYKLTDTTGARESTKLYRSDILESIKHMGLYDSLLDVIRCSAFTGASKSEIVRIIRKRFPDTCKSLNVSTFNRWVEYYPEVGNAFSFTRDYCLGQLVYLGLLKSAKSVNWAKDDFILKLLDRVDYGVLSNKSDDHSSNNSVAHSTQTNNTVTRILAESSRFGGLDSVVVEGDPDEV